MEENECHQKQAELLVKLRYLATVTTVAAIDLLCPPKYLRDV